MRHKNLTAEEMVRLGRKVEFWKRRVDNDEFDRPVHVHYSGVYRGIGFLVSETILYRQTRIEFRKKYEAYSLSAGLNRMTIGNVSKSFRCGELEKFFYEVQRKFEQQTDTPTSKLPETQEEALKYARALLKE